MIEWKTSKYGVLLGYIGEIEVITIDRSMDRNEKGKEWVIKTRLPGLIKAFYRDTEQSAKDLAEKILQSWLDKAGLRVKDK